MKRLAIRTDLNVLFPAALIALLMPFLAAVDALLRYDHVVTRPDPWSVWPLTPGITLATLLAAYIYIAGQRHSANSANSDHQGLRHFAFFGGLAALFLALQSPIEPISDHLFVVHQVEHMLLRTVAPMLLMVGAPQAALIRGLPNWMRRYVVSPLLSRPAIRALAFLGHPAVATMLFVGTTYFWMIPRYHDLAILDEPIHYLWHTTLLLSGLIFFWRVFDSRPYPRGTSLGVRLFMFWCASVGNILLGSYLSFKHQVLYHAYGDVGRMWGLSPLDDETCGGLIMWVMGGMMFGATAVLMVYRWALEEDSRVARQNEKYKPVKAADLQPQRKAANREMAIGLVCFVFTVLIITFATVFVYHYSADFSWLAGL